MTNTPSPRLSKRRSPPAPAVALQDRIETYLLHQSRRMFAPLPRVISNGNAEELHQMRVCSRRLRVGLQFFSVLFTQQELKQVQRQLRRITRALGEIRALDVNIRLIRRALSRLPVASRLTVTSLRQNMLLERNVRLAELRELMQMLSVSQFAHRVETLITHQDRQIDTARLVAATNDQLRDLRRSVRRRSKQYDRDRSGKAFHQLRIAAKRYRYGLEAGKAVFRAGETARIRSVEALQDRMGDTHDVEVLETYLEATQERWGEQDPELARTAKVLLRFFRIEYQKRFEAFESLVRADRTWLKKVRLQRPHE